MSNKEVKNEDVFKRAYYKGGLEAMGEFLQAHIKYPPEALENNIEGSVHVHFDIDKTGRVLRPKVLKGIGYGCDEEALRVVRLLEFVVPKNRGMKITFHQDLHIHFKLPPAAALAETPPAQQDAPPAAAIVYNYVGSKPNDTTTQEGVYYYQINL